MQKSLARLERYATELWSNIKDAATTGPTAELEELREAMSAMHTAKRLLDGDAADTAHDLADLAWHRIINWHELSLARASRAPKSQ